MTGLTPYKTDLFIPTYQPIKNDRWEMTITPMHLSRGYWSESALVQNMAALSRFADDGSKSVWMSTTPMEMESQEIGIRLSSGYTLVAGMGMGWAAINAALRPEVSRVTVVELDPEVIAMNETLGTFRNLPDEAARKIDIVNASALEFKSDAPVDTLMADIWLPLNGDDRVDQTRIMADNTQARRVYIWGQEMVIARRARALGLELTHDTVARVIDELGLPLIGLEWPNYPELVALVAGRWLKDV